MAPQVTFIPSTRGGRIAVYKQFMYKVERHLDNGKSYWKCYNKTGCKARLTTFNELYQNDSGYHTRKPDPQAIMGKTFRHKLKNRAEKDLATPVPKIYSEEIAQAAVSVEAAAVLPSFDTMSKAMYRARSVLRPPLPQSIENLEINCVWTENKQGQRFLIADDGVGDNRMLVIHTLFICYALYVMDGGKSDEFYSPYFELDKSGAEVAGAFTIVFSFLFLSACFMLTFGVKRENRCLFFPWMIGVTIEILLMVAVGLWYIVRYYHNPYSFLAAIVLWCFDGLHIYCLLCVISEYQTLRDMQEPRFIILYP